MVNEPLFDLRSYARQGPARRDRLSSVEIAQIGRTVRHAPEVMVKVLSRGGQDLKAVGRHLEYLRHRETGELPIDTDEDRHLSGSDAVRGLLDDWDLDLEEHRPRPDLDVLASGSRKLVHKLLFSMPPSTPPEKLLTAVKNFAREEFALKHRYAMVLHTDEPHPHVHMVVKAVSEQGIRLHIRKATLREWRRAFAQHLRALGIAANATERAIRGATEPRKLDGIYRASRDPHRHSTHMEERTRVAAEELARGGIRVESGKSKLVATRREVERGWQAVSEILIHQGERELVAQVKRYVREMPLPLTEKEQLAGRLLRQAQKRQPPERPPLKR